MANRTEGEILAEAYESVRGLSKFYISKIDKIDVNKSIEVDGVSFNSAYWILAHLVWTEHFLLIEGLGGKLMDIPWLKEYKIGSDMNKIKQKPPVKEILKKMDDVHSAAVTKIKALTDEQMDEPNHVD